MGVSEKSFFKLSILLILTRFSKSNWNFSGKFQANNRNTSQDTTFIEASENALLLMEREAHKSLRNKYSQEMEKVQVRYVL